MIASFHFWVSAWLYVEDVPRISSHAWLIVRYCIESNKVRRGHCVLLLRLFSTGLWGEAAATG